MSIDRITDISELERREADGTLLGLFDLPIELYHAGPGVSSSGLKEILRSPAHYEDRRGNPSSSAAMRTGSVAHTLLLEPHKFKTDYAIADCASSTAKAFEMTKLANPGKTVVCRTEAEDGSAIAKAVRANRFASNVLLSPGGLNEVSVYWRDPDTDVLCKARADRITRGTIADLKTTQDARFHKFQRSVVDFKYHLSAAFYVDGFNQAIGEQHDFCWIAAESVRPHEVAFYAADPLLIETGRAEYKLALRAYRDHVAANFIAGYPESFVNLCLPGWYQ